MILRIHENHIFRKLDFPFIRLSCFSSQFFPSIYVNKFHSSPSDVCIALMGFFLPDLDPRAHFGVKLIPLKPFQNALESSLVNLANSFRFTSEPRKLDQQTKSSVHRMM